MKNSHRFYKNIKCKYFPCHKGVKRSEFNCLFCFCPLYHRFDCGGKYEIKKNKKKDCSRCVLPHTKLAYDYIMNKLKEEKRSVE